MNGGKFELDGKYEIVYSNVRGEYGEAADEITLQNNESVVLKKAVQKALESFRVSENTKATLRTLRESL